MSSGFATFILMNNYFHDVATAMFSACSVVLWIFLKKLGNDFDEGLRAYMRSLYRGVSAVFWFSAVWLVGSGILRFITFTRFEWVNASRGKFEAGLLVKYVIAGCMVLIGVMLWVRLSQEMKKRLLK